MERHNPPARSRKGAAAKVELDGSVTLYGVEDWTEVKDEPVFLTVPRPDSLPEEAPSDAAGGEERRGDEEAGSGPEGRS